MADSDKNIIITPSVGSTSEPTIVFTGGDNNPVTLRILDDGTLSFEGSSGQLFSVTDSLTGTIFSVNDISGIPSLEIEDDGTVSIAEFSGNVGIGNASPSYKFDVTGTANFQGSVRITDGTSYSSESIVTIATTTTSSQVVDSYDNADAIKYIVYVTDGTDNQVSEFLVTNDGSDAFFTQYGNICTLSSDLSAFDISYSSGTTSLLATPAVANLTFKINRKVLS